MNAIQTYIEENKGYLGEDNESSICQVPEAAWSAVIAATEELGGGSDPGIDCSVAVTHETLADFDASRLNHWAERGSRKEFIFDGFKAVKYERFQLFRGNQRRDQIVVDLGNIRVALV